MKIYELRKKPKEEIQKILKDDREKLKQLRFDLAAGKVRNIREIRKVKKEIAQILTLLTELHSSGAESKRINPLFHPSLRLGQVKKRTKFSSPQQ